LERKVAMRTLTGQIVAAVLPFSATDIFLFSFSLGWRERRPLPRDTPRCGPERRSSVGLASPPKSREPCSLGGEEATVASSGVVTNAARRS